jgi:molybdopterin-containing oxidoreductase family iron-sulfur binding subunit
LKEQHVPFGPAGLRSHTTVTLQTVKFMDPSQDIRTQGLPVLEGGGKQYWRSLDELAGTPEFAELVAREFPSQLPQWNDGTGRRDFLKLMGASLALAGVTGCSREPEEKIIPYVRAPEEMIPGKPRYFATAMTRGGYALGVLAESHMGRPTKIEGNPEHPASLGSTDAFAQASILGLYDPDRSQTVMKRGAISTWDAFLTAISIEFPTIQSRQGAGLRILTENVTSPTLVRQVERLLEDLPDARWCQYEPLASQGARSAAETAFGRQVETVYHFDQAEVVVSLGSDFLIDLPGSVRYARDFIAHHRVAPDNTTMSRLYVAESMFTLTGAMADHRVALPPAALEQLARAIASGVGAEVDSSDAPASLPEGWLEALIADLREHEGASLVIAGPGQPAAMHLLAHAINAALGSVGRTVTYHDPFGAKATEQHQSLAELVEEMQAGSVETLVILGGNPVYQSPGELQFGTLLQEKVKLRIHMSDYYDETSFLCDWHLPAAHYLESWGDARAFDGTASIVQPLIAPLYSGRTPYEVLSVLLGEPGRSPYELVQETWKERLGEEDFATAWRKAVHDGVVPDTAAASVEVSLAEGALDEAVSQAESTAEGDGTVDVLFAPDPSVWDGRYANIGWLQELPKPLSKVTWDNVIYLGPALAKRLQADNGSVLKLELGEQTLVGPAWILPGHADGCVTVTFGYGRTRAGRLGNGVGYDAYAFRPADSGWLARGASIRSTGGKHKLATTQQHHNVEGRDLMRVTTLARYEDDPDHLKSHDHHGQGEGSLSFYPEFEYDGNAWGMVIDQTACIGCNACVVACQAENNIPIVGKEQVTAGREMHWLRIDQYYIGEPEDPESYFQPMLCMHCEKAPCEVVCPVAATVHSSEGLNDMVYNRCVGTRYCSNNCPYKVRRFNYLQFTDEETPSLKLLRNPDVTVRSRGVMEKCTYCVQRINHARIDAKKENRAIRDGEVVTACQGACPTRAIVFGNINDANSQVHQLKHSPLNYGLLKELNTQPRTTYLARVVNPHPDLPPPSAAETDEEHHPGTAAEAEGRRTPAEGAQH